MNEVNERKIVLIYIFCYLKPYIKVGNSPCYIYYWRGLQLRRVFLLLEVLQGSGHDEVDSSEGVAIG